MADLTDAVRKYASELADKLNDFMKHVSTLEVRTYTTNGDDAQTSVNLRTLDLRALDDSTAQGQVSLRARTNMTFDGDVVQLAPKETNGEIDQQLWQLHQQAVEQSTAYRARMLQALGEAAAATLRALRVANGG